MTSNIPLLAALSAGVAVVLLIQVGAVLLSRGSSARQLNRRLRLLEGGGDRKVVLRKLSRRGMAGEGGGGLSAALLEYAPVRALDHLAGRAGVLTPIDRLVLAMVGSAAAADLALVFLGGLSAPQALVLGPLAAVAVWVAALYRMGVSRSNRFNEQLPEALSLMARSLRVGHPISAAIALVAREMPDPLGSELGLVFDEMTYGLDLGEALDNLCNRMSGRALRYMTVAISIQHSTGGNLAELLLRLAGVLRDIDRMHRKVKALSAEGRLSAAILSVLPFAVAFGIAMVAPGYYDAVLSDPPFLAVLWAAGAGMAIGVVVMIRMVNFRF